MEIKQIKYFVEVVRQGGMTQASEHLYIAQSTISKAIKNIENEYDITLFDRSQNDECSNVYKCIESVSQTLS